MKDGWGYWEVNTRYPEDFIDYAVRHHEDVEILEPQAIRDRLKEKFKKFSPNTDRFLSVLLPYTLIEQT